MGLAQYADDGLFAPKKIAEAFGTASEEIARTADLGKDADVLGRARISNIQPERDLPSSTG
ncbi:hypothetical protein ABID26_006526 [Mesorhizobium shonense]|uniref:Uncharacterized protein n=1 Tax=Mesorhizobium shonense TaxID=1209948 RepID=A0ABV2I2E8_9HYPH|nr:hypothetical protein [Mesorhizobium sp.]TIS49163.1 MAG: hypothetical protein E5W96_15605 [Mesorhizobium sp.]